MLLYKISELTVLEATAYRDIETYGVEMVALRVTEVFGWRPLRTPVPISIRLETSDSNRQCSHLN